MERSGKREGLLEKTAEGTELFARQGDMMGVSAE